MTGELWNTLGIGALTSNSRSRNAEANLNLWEENKIWVPLKCWKWGRNGLRQSQVSGLNNWMIVVPFIKTEESWAEPTGGRHGKLSQFTGLKVSVGDECTSSVDYWIAKCGTQDLQ